MYEDLRYDASKDVHELLTEDSDDAFADLEKEYAVKKQKLMEERSRKRDQEKRALEVQRSPSPKRVKKETKPNVDSHNFAFSSSSQAAPQSNSQPLWAPSRAFQRVHAVPSTQFATRLFENEKQSSTVDYNRRFFEFKDLPQRKSIALNEQNKRDSMSGEELRRRSIEEKDSQRLLHNTKILRVSKLLAKVVAPTYDEPSYTNWCLAGIIIYKSDPKTAVNGKKYMTFRVGDFNLTVDLFIFGDAFQKYWKLRCGDVITVLNPTIKKHGRGFNLLLQENLDCILEIGASKNFGYCSATNKEGKACKFVIDLSKNDLCSIHEESKFKQGSRMELQGSVKPKAPRNKQGQTSQAFSSRATSQPLYVQYLNAGFQEKDAVYEGGEQFDQAKYDRPVKENEAAKLRKRKANEKLRMQLLNNAPPNRLNDLDKLGIVPQNESDLIERQNSLSKIKSQAFKNTFLRGMGYDPTFEKSSGLDKVKPTASIQELRSISKTKRVSLKPSEEEQRKKLARQKTAISIIRDKSSATKDAAKLIGPGRKAMSSRSPSMSRLITNDSSNGDRGSLACDNGGAPGNADSDSDLEISFACHADQIRYNNAISGPNPGT